MDFGILLKAIGAMALIVATCGILMGWVDLVDRMIKNRVTNLFISGLPVLSFGVYMFYHTIAAVQ